MHPYEQAWFECYPATTGAKILEGDDALLKLQSAKSRPVLFESLSKLMRDYRFGDEDKRFHLSLVPQPFFGTLTTANVVVLTLNPGLNSMDYISEFLFPDYLNALDATRKQCVSSPFPFIWLDPRFSYHPGYKYWHGRFRQLIKMFADCFKLNLMESTSFFARSIAVMELLPYHSEASPNIPESLLTSLRSFKLALSYVQDVLLPRAKSGKLLLVAVRRIPYWELPTHPNVVIYTSSGEKRSARLSLKSRGGPKILEHLVNVWKGGV